MKSQFWAILGFFAVIAGPAHSASLLYNGDFEGWTGVTGTPPTGTLSNWYNTPLPVRSAGLVAGSTYSATVTGGTQLAQTPTTLTNSFVLNFSFAATYAVATNTNGGSIGMRLNLYNAAASTIIQSFVLQDAGASGLTLAMRDGSTGSWKPIVTGLAPSTYDSVTGTWATPSVYDFSLTADWTTGICTLKLGLDGQTQTSYSASYYYGTAADAAATTMGRVFMIDGITAVGTAFAVDNMTLNAIPEPNSLALLLSSVLVLGFLVRRRAFTS